MIDPETLLEHFESRLLSLAISGIGAASVNTGGEPFRHAGKGLWFEIAAEPAEEAGSTETLERRFWTVVVTAVFPPGIGLARGFAAARRVAELYVPFDPELGAFTLEGARFYTVRVTLEKSRFADGQIRLPVTFRFLALVPYRRLSPSGVERPQRP